MTHQRQGAACAGIVVVLRGEIPIQTVVAVLVSIVGVLLPITSLKELFSELAIAHGLEELQMTLYQA